jgi:anaerobic selenocysteine-containing dehydrogenase
VGGEWPTAVLAEEIETPGEGQIRGLVTIAGNPVLSSPNGRRLERALAGLDTMVSIDAYLNETTRHAHLVLPPSSVLERDHYDLVFHALAVRNTAKYSPPLFAPPPGARHDWQILLGLAQRLQARRGARAVERGVLATAARLGPRGLLDVMLRTGPHGPRLGFLGRGLTLARLEKQPHGVDLGPLQPRLPGALQTKERRLRLVPQPLAGDVPRLRAALDARRDGLALIGRRDLRSNNSWLHNSQRLVKGPERCTLLMHPEDASARGVADGSRVHVSSRVGRIECQVQVTGDMRPGVVSLPHGWGHDREGTRLAVAGARPGASVNDLTDDAFLDVLSGNAAFNGVPVEVAPA